jgi:hypothetical protein
MTHLESLQSTGADYSTGRKNRRIGALGAALFL